jgi:DDE_Tnp_1-associated
MPAVALSRVAARAVESGPDGKNLAPGAWQRLEALPNPRSPQGRIYPLACLIAIALCAFTAAGNDRFTAVGQWIRRAGQAGRPGRPGCTPRGTRSPAGTGHRMRKRSGSSWTASTCGPCSGRARAGTTAGRRHQLRGRGPDQHSSAPIQKHPDTWLQEGSMNRPSLRRPAPGHHRHGHVL